MENLIESYNDPRTGLSNAYSFYKSLAKKLDVSQKYTYADVKRMISMNEAYQINKQGTKINYFPITGQGEYSFQIDLMFPNPVRGFTAILCVINVNTRVAYAYAIKSKTQTYDKLKEWIDYMNANNLKVNFIQSDKGSEFNNKKVKELFEDNDIEFDTVNTADHKAQGKVERFNGSLRRLITVYESANKSSDWVSVLDDLIFNYNNRFHRSIGCSPAEADENTDAVRQAEQFRNAKQDFDKFKVGNNVRVLLNKDKFQHGRREWSDEIYKVVEIKGNLIGIQRSEDEERVLYKKHYELQIVMTVVSAAPRDDAENLRNEKTKVKSEKTAKRRLAKENIVSSLNDTPETIQRRSTRTKEIFDKSLVGRKINRNGEKGTITAYDPDGEFKWFVKFNKEAKRDSEFMNKNELKLYLD